MSLVRGKGERRTLNEAPGPLPLEITNGAATMVFMAGVTEEDSTMGREPRAAALEAITQEIARALEAMNTPNPNWLHNEKAAAEILNVLRSIQATRAARPAQSDHRRPL